MIKNGIYKHFKGGEVLVFGTANTPDESIDVLYKGMQNGKIYARPLESFLDEIKNAEGEMVERFRLVEEIHDIDLINYLETKTPKQKD